MRNNERQYKKAENSGKDRVKKMSRTERIMSVARDRIQIIYGRNNKTLRVK